MAPVTNHKITAEHLARKAFVYLRQSSMRQVRENLESQRLQYDLVNRARNLGWERVEVIDIDLGYSASIGSQREGFDLLISAVAQKDVGIVIGREVSRLTRTDKDFCRLIEVCQIFGTLIGDEDNVYDLNSIDDQLVLGIKATMSVAELKVLELRLLKGKEEKAKRGELIIELPVGYVQDGAGKVVIDPDERTREAIASIFQKYREFWSIRQTWQWFRTHNIQLPVKKASAGESIKVVWKLPSREYIYSLLTHPYYAGVYTYGRHATKTVFEDGRLIKKRVRPIGRRPDQYKVFIPDHHPGYIDWRTYEEIQETMSRSNTKPGAFAAVRSGSGLLAGLLRCGHCGRKLHVAYRSKAGWVRYACHGDYEQGGDRCITVGGQQLELRVCEELLEAICPLGMEASLQAIEEMKASRSEESRRWTLELQHLDYEVQRAFEQYDQVDPRNRLVAAELERRWNAKMQEREEIKEALAVSEAKQEVLKPEEEAKILVLGSNFDHVWENSPNELKKKILHTVIEEIIVAKPNDRTISLMLHWKGGCHTKVELKKRESSNQKTKQEALDVIRKMAEAGYGDFQIAGILNRMGIRTGKDNPWNQSRVLTARRTYSIPGQQRRAVNPEILSLQQAAEYCNVATSAIRRLVKDGLVSKRQVVEMAPWELRCSELDSEPVRRFLEHLRRTGRYPRQGGCYEDQKKLFN